MSVHIHISNEESFDHCHICGVKMCPSVANGYGCTLAEGHSGKHINEWAFNNADETRPPVWDNENIPNNNVD